MCCLYVWGVVHVMLICTLHTLHTLHTCTRAHADTLACTRMRTLVKVMSYVHVRVCCLVSLHTGEMFKSVLEVDVWSSRALVNWGRAMCLRAELSWGQREVVQKLYRAALDKFEAVLEEEPGTYIRVCVCVCALACLSLSFCVCACVCMRVHVCVCVQI